MFRFATPAGPYAHRLPAGSRVRSVIRSGCVAAVPANRSAAVIRVVVPEELLMRMIRSPPWIKKVFPCESVRPAVRMECLEAAADDSDESAPIAEGSACCPLLGTVLASDAKARPTPRARMKAPPNKLERTGAIRSGVSAGSGVKVGVGSLGVLIRFSVIALLRFFGIRKPHRGGAFLLSAVTAIRVLVCRTLRQIRPGVGDTVRVRQVPRRGAGQWFRKLCC